MPDVLMKRALFGLPGQRHRVGLPKWEGVADGQTSLAFRRQRQIFLRITARLA